MESDRIYRIGDKLISLDQVIRLVDKAMIFREQGLSQHEVSKRLQLDRSFISRLESVGEIRKGSRIAVIGFPLSNKDEIASICLAHGLDFYLLLNNKERWGMVEDKQALEFFNSMLELVTHLREFDTLIMITSIKWFHLAEALLDIQIIHLELGPTPIDSDLPVDPEQLKSTIKQVLSKE